MKGPGRAEAGHEPESVLLAVDCAAEGSTCALLCLDGKGHQVVAERDEPGTRAHATVLLVAIDTVLEAGGYRLEEVSGAVVGTGPGTFTGVRMGIATVRALGFARGIPVHGVTSLTALVAARVHGGRGGGAPDVVVPALDARRGQVFVAPYVEEDGFWTRVEPPSAVDIGALPEWISGQAGRREYGFAAPPGLASRIADAVGGRVSEVPLRAAHLIVGQEKLSDGIAAELERAQRYARAGAAGGSPLHADPGAPGSPEAVVPRYVRAPDADTQIHKMRDPWNT